MADYYLRRVDSKAGKTNDATVSLEQKVQQYADSLKVNLEKRKNLK